LENVPLREGSEEYLDSEKYQLKQRRLDGLLLPLVKRLNEVRRENPALQRFDNLTFLETESDNLIAYAKRRGRNSILCVVNVDPLSWHEGLAIVPAALGLPPAFPVRDLISGDTFVWHTGRNYVALGAGQSHVMQVAE
jgi:starch synthase (maltosyl-transferring)